MQKEEKADVKDKDEIVFMYDDDDKNPNFTAETAEEKKKKKAAVLKKVRTGLAITGGIIVAVYLAFTIYFSGHFYFYTKINGNEFSAQSVKKVEEFMKEQVNGYSLTIQRNDNQTETIVGSDISLRYSPGNELKEAVKKQNAFLWPKAFFKKDNLKIPVGVKYDKEALNALIEKLDCVTNKEPAATKSAVPVFDGNEFVIQKEVIGTKVDMETFPKVVEEHLNGFRDTLDMMKTKCYVQPKYFADSPEVLEAQKQMNSYLGAHITYDFKPHTEVVDSAAIAKWLTVDGDMKVVFDKKKVKKYIRSLADKYDTSGKPRYFVTANGNTVKVENGIYGWKINQEKEYKQLVADIEAKKTVTREPEYSRRAKSHSGNDFGSTYAEVDLTRQYMWFIQNGKVVLQTPVVTGNPNNGNATPQGTYTLTYKQQGAVLRGKLLPDGTREYETPVDYWMPFNGGIGFHDANWQSAFGGSRYLTHGSHGCVNMPPAKAAELFGIIKSGTPVICHY